MLVGVGGGGGGDELIRPAKTGTSFLPIPSPHPLGHSLSCQSNQVRFALFVVINDNISLRQQQCDNIRKINDNVTKLHFFGFATLSQGERGKRTRETGDRVKGRQGDRETSIQGDRKSRRQGDRKTGGGRCGEGTTRRTPNLLNVGNSKQCATC